ncbi:hypothetical protein HY212_03440 [Candidatus Pacearchaeota archaeon]|nr:hypothetical protein [Candidatus Pacearchaeota archaeon]
MVKNITRILSFFIFPALVYALALFLGAVFDAFNVYTWIDIPFHFLGGLSIAYTSILFLRFFREKGFIEINKRALSILFVVSLVILVAVFWEFYEFLMKTFFNLNMQPSVADTMKDLFMGLVGGFAGALVFTGKQ